MRSISHRGPQGHSQGGHASAKHQIPKPQELRPQTAIQVLLQTAANKKHKQSIADESTSSHQTPITGANSYQEPLATELSPAAISLARSLARLQASLKSKPQHKQSSLGHKGLRPAPATPPSAKRPARSPTKSPQSPPCPEEPTQTAGSPLGDRLSRVERMASESSQHVRELERLDIPVLLQAHGSELSSLSESFDRLRDHLSEVQAGSDARSHAHSAALEELFGQMLQTLSTQLAGEIEALGTRLEQVAGAQERIEDTAAAAATAAVAAAAESAEDVPDYLPRIAALEQATRDASTLYAPRNDVLTSLRRVLNACVAATELGKDATSGLTATDSRVLELERLVEEQKQHLAEVLSRPVGEASASVDDARIVELERLVEEQKQHIDELLSRPVAEASVPFDDARVVELERLVEEQKQHIAKMSLSFSTLQSKAQPPKVEPPKAQPPKVEPPKAQPPKVEPPKAQPPKVEPPKAQPPKVEPPKVEPTKPAPPKPAAPKPEPAKVEPPKPAPAKPTPAVKVSVSVKVSPAPLCPEEYDDIPTIDSIVKTQYLQRLIYDDSSDMGTLLDMSASCQAGKQWGPEIYTAHKDGSVKQWSLPQMPAGELPGLAQGDTEGLDVTTCSSSFHAHKGPVSAIDALPGIIATASDQRVRVWTPGKQKANMSVKLHSAQINSLRFHPRLPALMVTSSKDKTLKVFDHTTKKIKATLAGHTKAVNIGIPSSADPAVVASGSNDYCVRVWDVARKSSTNVLKGHSGGRVRALSWLHGHSGKLLASGATDDSVVVWDMSSGKQAHSMLGLPAAVTSLWLGSTLLAAGTNDGSICFWDLRNPSEELSTMQMPSESGRAGVNAIFCSDEKHFIASCTDGLVLSLQLF